MSIRALIVDDSSAMRKIVERSLRQAGIDLAQVFEAGNGAEALGVLNESQVDLILCDINMPVMDGLEFVKQLSRVENAKLAVAQASQQVLSNVGNLFQLVEAQESAGALDGVNGTKHARQRVLIVRVFLQADQVPVQPVQVLVALDQKILDDVTVAHRAWSFPNWEWFPTGEGLRVTPCLNAPVESRLPRVNDVSMSLRIVRSLSASLHRLFGNFH